MVHQHRRLNGNGAAAAKRVPKQHILPWARRRRNGGGKSFPQRGLPRKRAITAFVQRCAAKVDHNIRFVAQNKKFDLKFCARFLKPYNAVFRAQRIHRRLFHDFLAIRNAEQAALYGMSLHGEGILRADPFGKRQRPRAVIKLRKAFCMKRAEQKIQPLRIAQPKAAAGNRLHGAFKINASVNGFQPAIAERINLFAEKMLKPEQAACNQGNLCLCHAQFASRISAMRSQAWPSP